MKKKKQVASGGAPKLAPKLKNARGRRSFMKDIAEEGKENGKETQVDFLTSELSEIYQSEFYY